MRPPLLLVGRCYRWTSYNKLCWPRGPTRCVTPLSAWCVCSHRLQSAQAFPFWRCHWSPRSLRVESGFALVGRAAGDGNDIRALADPVRGRVAVAVRGGGPIASKARLIQVLLAGLCMWRIAELVTTVAAGCRRPGATDRGWHRQPLSRLRSAVFAWCQSEQRRRFRGTGHLRPLVSIYCSLCCVSYLTAVSLIRRGIHLPIGFLLRETANTLFGTEELNHYFGEIVGRHSEL